MLFVRLNEQTVQLAGVAYVALDTTVTPLANVATTERLAGLLPDTPVSVKLAEVCPAVTETVPTVLP